MVRRARGDIAHLNGRHHYLANLEVFSPGMTREEMAKECGLSVQEVGLVMRSEAFIEEVYRKRAELMSKGMKKKYEQKMMAMLDRAMDVIMEKLSLPVEKISDTMAIRSAELGTKALGISDMPGSGNDSEQGDRLERLAERLVALKRKGDGYEAVDVEAREIEKRSGCEEAGAVGRLPDAAGEGTRAAGTDGRQSGAAAS